MAILAKYFKEQPASTRFEIKCLLKCLFRFERVLSYPPCPLVGQVYKDRNVVAQLVRRAERAGFKAIALTVDTPRLGRREADIKNRY